MKIDSPKIAEGTQITNLSAPVGTSFPGSPNEGEMFYRSDSDILYLYTTDWKAMIASGSDEYVTAATNQTSGLTGNKTWAGVNKFAGTVDFDTTTTYAQVGKVGSSPRITFGASAGAANEKLWSIDWLVGASLSIRSFSDDLSVSRSAWAAVRSGAAITGISYGNATDNPTHTFYGNTTINGTLTATDTIVGASNFVTSDTDQSSGLTGAKTWSAKHTFTGSDANHLGIEIAKPTVALLGLNNTDATANNRMWTLRSQGGSFVLHAYSDDMASAHAAYVANRSGINISTVEYGNAADAPLHYFYGSIQSKNGISINNGQPTLELYNTAGGTDDHSWLFDSSGANLRLMAVNDAYSVYRSVLNVSRSSTAVTGMSYGNSTDNPTHTFYGPLGVIENGTYPQISVSSNATWSIIRLTNTGSVGAIVQLYEPGGNKWNVMGYDGAFSIRSDDTNKAAYTAAMTSGNITGVSYGNSTDNPPHTFYGHVLINKPSSAVSTLKAIGNASNNIAIEGVDNTGVYSIILRPNVSGVNVISSDYIGGSYLPLALSGRGSNSDFVLGAGGGVTIGAPNSGTGIIASGAANAWTARFTGSATSGQSYGLEILAGTNSGDQAFSVYDKAVTVQMFGVRGDGLTTISNAQVNTLGTGPVYSNGSLLTSTNPSDQRLKTNIENTPYGLAEIMQLRAVQYDWINDSASQGKQFGFLAQEVQAVMPDAIKPYDQVIDGVTEQYLGLEKDAIYSALVKAIQELKAEFDAYVATHP